MGNIIESKCKSCGFSNEFRYGGGRFSYQTNCPVPAINKKTLEFENVNYLEHKDSDKYLFYSDDIFIHPSIVTKLNLEDGMNFKGNAIKSFNKDKKIWSWKLVYN